MTYQLLALNGVDSRTQTFIRARVEPFLRDVHTMLRLPILESELEGGCNFSAPLVLFSVIAGLSVHLYQPPKLIDPRETGKFFVGLMLDHYPWNVEPNGAVPRDEAANTIYDWYRNLLIHRAGVEENNRSLELKVLKAPLSEAEIEAIELATVRPFSDPTLRREGSKRVLTVCALYWGVRQMAVRLALHRSKSTVVPVVPQTASVVPSMSVVSESGRALFSEVTSTAPSMVNGIEHLKGIGDKK